MSDNVLSLIKGEGANKIEPETDLTRWRLSTVEGRQKWYYMPENEECAREQNAVEAYTLGLNTSKFFPELPKASTAQEAVLKAINFFSGVQAEDGHWPAECSGVFTLAPERGIQFLIDKQRAIGDWPQGDIAAGFYKGGTLHYSAYRNIFPIFALARFTHLYPDNPLARQHLKNETRPRTEGQTTKC